MGVSFLQSWNFRVNAVTPKSINRSLNVVIERDCEGAHATTTTITATATTIIKASHYNTFFITNTASFYFSPLVTRVQIYFLFFVGVNLLESVAANKEKLIDCLPFGNIAVSM